MGQGPVKVILSDAVPDSPPSPADAADLSIGDEDACAAGGVLAVHGGANPIVGSVILVGGTGAA